jgi:uroporphyrinogen-III synthase
VRVLVTRPEPGASRTAAKLRDMGLEPVVLPLSETRPLAVSLQAVPADAGAVAVTSANALRHAPPELIEALAALPCHAVGKRTAEAARAAGFTWVVEGSGDALGLADRIAEELAGRVLVYPCGHERFPGFEERLVTAGVQVRPIETYDTIAVDYVDDAVLSRLAGQPVDALLLYSAKAADAARRLAARPALAHLFRNTRIFALSRRVGAAFGAQTRIAARPDEDSLLSLLANGG